MTKKFIDSVANGIYTVTATDRNKHLIFRVPAIIQIPRISTWTLDDEMQVTSFTDGDVSFVDNTSTADIFVVGNRWKLEGRNASAMVQRIDNNIYLVTGNLV